MAEGPITPGAPTPGPVTESEPTLPIIPVPLRRGQWVDERNPKKRIVIHHTEGASAQSSIDWWNQTIDRVATAYIIERDGVVMQTFDDNAWAYHTGLGAAYDRASIAIEIASEGSAVDVNAAGEVRAFGRPFPGNYWKFKVPWRGDYYHAAYSPFALKSCFLLVKRLCAAHGIPAVIPNHPATYQPVLRSHAWAGVLGHSTIRADKSDPHRMFPWAGLRAYLAGSMALNDAIYEHEDFEGAELIKRHE